MVLNGLTHDEMEAISFLDAQTNSALLNPVEIQLGDAMASREELHSSEEPDASENDLILIPSVQARDRQIEVINGQQQEEEAGIKSQGQASTEGGAKARHIDPIREARKREEEKEKEKRRLQREAEEKQQIIVQALETRRIIRSQKLRLEREGQLCSSWSAGRSGNEAVGRQVSGLWQSSRPTHKEVAQRDALIKDAEEAIEKRWPGCGLRLVPFGSTRTGLIESRSDVDLTLYDPIRPFGVGTPKSELELPPKGASHGFLIDSGTTYGIPQLPDYYSVNMVASALRRFGKNDKGMDKFIKVIPVKARVPIVKLIYAPCGLSSDINVNDGFGIVNSEMLAAYCDVDTEVVRPFLFAIKKWASRRGINDPAGKSGLCSLNSYTICLIAIQFLQIRGVVPNLQDEELISEPDRIRTCLWQKPNISIRGHGVRSVKAVIGGFVDPETGARRFDTTFIRPEDEKAEGDAGKKGDIPISIYERHVRVGDLFKGFFVWLSEFDFDECGISVRLGQPFRKRLLPKSKVLLQLPYLKPPSEQWINDAAIQCQDPFILDRNTAGAVKMEMRQIIIDEACRARILLEEDREDESTLLSDLLVDYDHEVAVLKHEAMMQSLDSDTRSVIVSRSAILKGSGKGKPRNRGKGKNRQRQR